jgi:hypothetical protein
MRASSVCKSGAVEQSVTLDSEVASSNPTRTPYFFSSGGSGFLLSYITLHYKLHYISDRPILSVGPIMSKLTLVSRFQYLIISQVTIGL